MTQPTLADDGSFCYPSTLLRVQLVILSVNRAGEIVPPRTKKNSPQIVPHMKFPILVPSESYREWLRGCKKSLKEQIIGLGSILPIAKPVNCRAIFYRAAKIGDAVGYYQALGDLLQENVGGKNDPELRVLTNDKYLWQWDGSRLAKDPSRPRVEVELTELLEKP